METVRLFRSPSPAPSLLPAGSPFSVPVHDTVDSSKVKCQGQGLGTSVRANVPQVFTVDASKAGVAPLKVRVQGPKGKPPPPPPKAILSVWCWQRPLIGQVSGLKKQSPSSRCDRTSRSGG